MVFARITVLSVGLFRSGLVKTTGLARHIFLGGVGEGRGGEGREGREEREGRGGRERGCIV